MNIDGFKEKLLAFIDLSKKPWYIHSFWFFIISAVGLSWPYRRYLDTLAVEKGFTFTKEVEI
jgi:hypothetical protein